MAAPTAADLRSEITRLISAEQSRHQSQMKYLAMMLNMIAAIESDDDEMLSHLTFLVRGEQRDSR